MNPCLPGTYIPVRPVIEGRGALMSLLPRAAPAHWTEGLQAPGSLSNELKPNFWW